MPAAGFYLGELLGLAALAYGLAWWLRRRERAVPAALAVAAALFAYAHFAGTPYQAAKSIVIAAPLAMLISARALISTEPLVELGACGGRSRGGAAGSSGVPGAAPVVLRATLALAFGAAATGSSLLALANGPVGPATYTPALTELRGGSGRAPPSCSPPSGCWRTSTVATTSSGSSGGAGSASPRRAGRPRPGRLTASRT